MSQTVSVRLDEDTLIRLDKMAKAADRSRAWLMAQAITQYVEHEAWQIEAIQQALKKMVDGNARFVEHDVVERWLSGWGTEEETGRPQP